MQLLTLTIVCEDTIIGHDGIKRIISGRKFMWIISYLHVCDMNKHVSRVHPEYSPLLNEREFQKNMKHLFNRFFVPGCFLSLN